MSKRNLETARVIPAVRFLRIGLVAALITAVCCYLDFETVALSSLEQAAYGLRLEVDGLLRQDLIKSARDHIATVVISDDSYAWAADGGPTPRYLPRTVYATLVNKLTSYGASVIAFDMDFDSPAPGDSDFAESIRESKRVVMGAYAADRAGQTTFIYPEQSLLNAGCETGVAVVYSVDGPGEDDIEPTVWDGKRSVPQLSVQTVKMYDYRQPRSSTGRPNLATKMNFALDPVDVRPAFKIHYLYDPSGVFTAIPIEAIVGSQNGNDSFFATHYFRNKIVLIGSTADIDHDFADTPMGKMAGITINANAVATMLSGSYIHKASRTIELFSMVFWVGCATVLASVRSLKRMGTLIVLVLPIYVAFNMVLFVEHEFYLHLAATAIAILLAATAVLLERGLTEEYEKARMRALLRRYVNPKIADHLLRNPETIGAGGKRQLGTILFCDIRDFTELSQVVSPEDLVSLMNDYFQSMTDIIFRHDGTAVSFVGDALMAVFGIPVSVDNHADQAVAAAIEMVAATSIVKDKWKLAKIAKFSMGIGINTGEVIVGEVGGRHLRNFTVYGVHVNIASRIEQANKQLETSILITQTTLDALTNKKNVKEPLSVIVKGVKEPLVVYEVSSI